MPVWPQRPRRVASPGWPSLGIEGDDLLIEVAILRSNLEIVELFLASGKDLGNFGCNAPDTSEEVQHLLRQYRENPALVLKQLGRRHPCFG
jgi:hypothetical protein